MIPYKTGDRVKFKLGFQADQLLTGRVVHADWDHPATGLWVVIKLDYPEELEDDAPICYVRTMCIYDVIHPTTGG